MKELRFAAIGCSHQGWSDISRIGSHPKVKMVALCDVDSTRFKQADKQWPGLPHFSDFRIMFDKMGDQIDAVNVTVPDHQHAFITQEAMTRGLHVYCEKPLTHTVWEARQMAKLAKKMGVVTRMGNQIHSEPQYRNSSVIIKEGKAIGKVVEVHTWISSRGHGRAGLLSPPKHPKKAPPELNWDQWIGPGPYREYGGDKIYHPFSWRDWQDYGSGAMGDNGCHLLDPLFTAMDLTAPISVMNNNSGINEYIWPAAETVEFLFPGTKYTEKDTLKITWYDGGRRPKWKYKGVPSGRKIEGPASLVVGTKGYLLVPHWGTPKLYPEKDFIDFKMPDVGKRNHWHDWVDACLSGNTEISDNFAYAGPLTETVQLGNIAAHFPNQNLKWDSKRLKITNVPEANHFLTKTYRKGWEVNEVTF